MYWGWRGSCKNLDLGVLLSFDILQYLQYVPNYEKHNILECQWFKVAWNPSRQLVWASEDNFFIPDSNRVFPRITNILSKAGVPKKSENGLQTRLYYERK